MAQLIKDKVAVLGDNNKVKVIAPDGFTGFPDMNKMPQAQGMYLTFAGLSIDQLPRAAPGRKLVDDYKAVRPGPVVELRPLRRGGHAGHPQGDRRLRRHPQGRERRVFTKGITMPANESVIGKELKIDPATGDVNAKDITVEIVKSNAETFLKAQSVS